MAFARIAFSLRLGLFGHAVANVASYELGRHKPHGYLGSTSSSEQIKNRTKHAAIVEGIAVGTLALINPTAEAAILLTLFTLPAYSYAFGRYRANVEEEKSSAAPTKRR